MRGCHHLCLPLLTVYLVVLTANIGGDSQDDGLYSPTDSVVILSGSQDDQNFYKHLFNKENAWMIEFYSSWCGHCIHFAPTYKKFAESIKGWSRVLSVGAVDCAQSKNVDVCRKYDINSYPSLLMFPPYSTAQTHGIISEGTRDMDNLLLRSVDYLSSRQHYIAPLSWPRLQPMATIEEIWTEASPKHQHVVLIFEDISSITGREIILDTMDQTHLLVRRLLKESVTKYGITQFPSLYSLNKDGVYKQLAVGIGGENDRGSFVAVMKELFGINANEGEEDGAGLGAGTDNRDKPDTEGEELPAHVTNIVGVHMQDLESALTYAFRQEVAIHKSMNEEAFSALKTFVLILAKYLPTRKPVSNFLWKVSNWLGELRPQLSGEEWSNHIESLQTKDSFLPDTVVWTGCHGSKLKFRGYPCSMWTLFHTLTVNAFLSKNVSVSHNPQEVLLAIAGYMKNYFGCSECVKNFGKMAATMPLEVKQRQDSVLWLWQAHNKANKRLHGQSSEDPLFPKIQFPTQVTCPKCHKPGSTNVNPIWNEAEVLNFLVHLYRGDHIKLDIAEKSNQQSWNNRKHPDSTRLQIGAIVELDWWENQQRKQDLQIIQKLRIRKVKNIQDKKVKDDWWESGIEQNDSERNFYHPRTMGNGWGLLSGVDIGMCMMFYVVCALIILLMYYHFTVRRNWRPCGFLPV